MSAVRERDYDCDAMMNNEREIESEQHSTPKQQSGRFFVLRRFSFLGVAGHDTSHSPTPTFDPNSFFFPDAIPTPTLKHL